MNVSVVDISANQKKLQVEIPAEKVRKEIEDKYQHLAKQVRIKGFRPGKVPRTILKSYYGKTIEGEVSNQLIQESFPEALREADVTPLVEADVDEMKFEEGGAFTYTAVVDVCPPFEVQNYKAIEIARVPVEVSAEEEQAELDRIREQHGQLQTVEEERPIEEGDVALVDFTPWVDDAVFEKGKTTDFMVEIGKNAIHPEFDGHIKGHKVGDAFSFELDYPEDAPTREIQGKRVRFDVTVKELKEKKLPELNDDFAKEAGQFDSLDALKQNIHERLLKREQDKASSVIRQKIIDRLLSDTNLELSDKVIEREIDRMVGLLQHQFQSQGLQVDTSRFNSPEIRGEYRPEAEKNLKRRLILQQIAKQEGIEVTDEDREEIYKQLAAYARMDVERVKSEYAGTHIVEQSEEGKIQDKVMKLLEDEAVLTDAPSEESKES